MECGRQRLVGREDKIIQIALAASADRSVPGFTADPSARSILGAVAERGRLVISIREANRGWGHNIAPRVGSSTKQRTAAAAESNPIGGAAEVESAAGALAGRDPAASEHTTGNAAAGDDTRDGGAGTETPERPWPIHPLGIVAGALLVLGVLYSTLLDTKYLIGNLEAWMWIGLIVIVGLSLWPTGFNGVRLGLESVASVTKRISMFLAWFVFIVQFFNVVTRYGTRYVDQDILIGEATSLAWMSFAALFLLGANYGIRDGVNPRIDFWWANFSDERKAWIDFVFHAFLFLPFVFMAIRILQPYAAISLGRKRDGSWPSGHRVWETWEQSPDADQLPVGPIKALLLVGFVLIGIQIVAELVKTGFVIAGRRRYGDLPESDAPARIE